jgi:hypothetical protein
MRLANMKKLLGKDNKGFSFVEILCTVAIMSLVSITVGTVIVVSAKTYRNGVSETTVQQEAQLAANSIGNIIKDASKVVYYDKDKGKLENGVKVDDYSDDTTKLTVVTNNNKQYDFVYDSSNKVITYKEIGSSGSESSEQILAANISSFNADTSSFAETRSITVDMDVTDESTGKSISLSYTMNSRNEAAGDVTYAEVSDAPVIIFLEDMACIVPGQGENGTNTYRIPVYVSGNLDESELTATYVNSEGVNDGKLQIGAVTTDYVEIYMKKNDYSSCKSSYKLTLQTKEKNADNTPKASSTCAIYIRSVTAITTTYSVDVSGATNKNREAKGAVYKFTAGVQGYNLTKFNRDFDSEYKDAYEVYWSYELTVDGGTYTYNSSKTEGNQYENQSEAEKYIKVTGTTENTTRPTFTLTLTDDMPSVFTLKVTATSKHASGQNKASVAYATVSGDVTVSKINDSFEVTLEPNETQAFDLGDMIKSKITESSNVTFKYFVLYYDEDKKESYYSNYTPADGTNAEYIRASNQVAISIGKNEKGNGDVNKNEYYSFYIGVYVDNVLASRIKVHVRRIDYLDVILKDAESKDVYSSKTVYHFNVRYNSTQTNQLDDLVGYLTNTEKIADIENALAVELSWAIKDETAVNDIESSDLISNNANGSGYSIVVKAIVQKVVVKEGWSTAKGIKDNQSYIKTKLETVKSEDYTCSLDGAKYTATVKQPIVRIYYADDNFKEILSYSVVQTPEIDFQLKDTKNKALPTTSCCHTDAEMPDLTKLGSSIGLSSGKKLVIKAIAKHPYADYNRGNEDYVVNPSDITDIFVLSQEKLAGGTTDYITVDNFARGNDNFVFAEGGWSSRTGTYITDKYPSGISGTQRTVFRYREVNDDGTTGLWSDYYDTLEKGLSIKFNGSNNESTIFLPDKSYDVEFANFVYTGTDDMILIWPYNNEFRSLIGIKAGNCSWNDISAVGETSWKDFAKTFRIGKTTVTAVDSFGDKNNYTTVLSGNGDTNIHFILNNLDNGHFQNMFRIKVEMLVEDENGKTDWSTISNDEDSDYVRKYLDSIEVKMDNGQLALCVSQNAHDKMASGKYRVSIVLSSTDTNPCFYSISGTTFNWTTKVKKLNFNVGTVYIEIP